MTILHVGSVVGFYLVLFAFLCILRLTASDTGDLEDVLRQAVRNAMFLADYSIKAAAADLRKNELDLRKALKGEKGYYLPFVEMACRWPLSFWLHCTPQLLFVLGQKRMTEIRDAVQELAR
jgi:hypothetical protein